MPCYIPVISRSRNPIVGLIASIAAMASFCPSAIANNQAGHDASANTCPEGVCAFRATRVFMARSDFHGWTLPSGVTTGESEWLAVQNAGTCTHGCIVQEGYVKANQVASGCSAGTGGDVKQLYYAIIPGSGGGDFVCNIGQVISSGEVHKEKLSRCNSSDWCFYLDGNPVGGSIANSGIGSTAPDAVIFSEFLCNACMDSGTQMRAEFGTDGTTGRAWQVSAASGDTGYESLKNADVSGGADDYCSGSPRSVWNLDPVSFANFWEIYWIANRVHC